LVSVYEGLPNSLLEYMASSLSAVVARLPFIDELIRDQQGGLLIDDPTPQRIGEAIVTLAQSAEKRARMGTISRAIIESGAFQVDREAREIGTLLMRVAGEREPEEAARFPEGERRKHGAD
jgi:glycosyltransferase involved in cell wall biosynthesis